MATNIGSTDITDRHYYIAVHGGAGVHRQATEKEVKQSLRTACARALAAAATHSNQDGGRTACALGMVEAAVSVLEDEPCLNAGTGSNLTLDGNVECDASIMSGACGAFGSVGAVSGVKNPIQLARAVLEYGHKEDKLGRVPPLTLVSHGAISFAKGLDGEAKPQLVDPSSLITPPAQRSWAKWTDRLRVESPPHDTESGLHDTQDTVGAVSWHPGDGMAAGVSSGGLLLKLPGRVGDAAVYGAGCWAEQQQLRKVVGEEVGDEGGVGVACSVSGTGEYIIRSQLARSVGEQAMRGLSSTDFDVHNMLQKMLEGEFWDKYKREGDACPSAGVLLLTREVNQGSRDNDGSDKGLSEDQEAAEGGSREKALVRLWCAFTTPSMAIAYASPSHPKPKALVLKHPDTSSSRDKPRIYITAIPL